MILLIDAGNTRIKWGGLDDGALQPGGAVPVAGDPIAELTAALQGTSRPDAVVAASVLGADFGASLNAWSRDQWGVEVRFVVAEARSGEVRNAYTEPARLGADRWLALIAARRIADGAVCIIDCGSALTVDVMDAGGEHLGGLIMPGLAMMRRSLARDTDGVDVDPARHPGKSPGEDVSLFARDTEGAVMGGTLYAAVAVIDRVVADVCDALGQAVTVLLTGGDAGAVRPLVSAAYQYEPDLVLKGLAAVAGERA